MIHKSATLPFWVFARKPSEDTTLEKDIARWIRICAPERSNRWIIANVLWLLRQYPEFRNVFYFRLEAYRTIFSRLLMTLARFFYKPLDTLKFFMSAIGPGLYIQYGLGTIVGAKVIGRDCWICQGVTIGYRDENSGLATIGNNVFVGAGSKILGSVTIGDNVIIGANSIVIKDVPANCTVAGVPARIIKKDGVKILHPFSST